MLLLLMEIEEIWGHFVQINRLSDHADSAVKHQLDNRFAVQEQDGDCASLMGRVGRLLGEPGCRDEDSVIVLPLNCTSKLVNVRTPDRIIGPSLSLEGRLDADGTLPKIAKPIYPTVARTASDG
jgi:hypothetical protein